MSSKCSYSSSCRLQQVLIEFHPNLSNPSMPSRPSIPDDMSQQRSYWSTFLRLLLRIKQSVVDGIPRELFFVLEMSDRSSCRLRMEKVMNVDPYCGECLFLETITVSIRYCGTRYQRETRSIWRKKVKFYLFAFGDA